MSKVDSITFRMYNTGSVGDCLLLLFKKNNVTSFRMLIDCGAWSANDTAISKCVADIKKECGKKIDLLVVTHEHKDHMSGFNQARQLFDGLEFGQVWMSWVENENDDVAALLKDKYVKALNAARQRTENSLKQLKKQPGSKNIKGAKQRLDRIRTNLEKTMEAIDFELGLPDGKSAKKNAKLTISDAMQYVKSRKKPDYKNPGDVIKNLKGAEGVKFYILGPPKDEDLGFIKKTTIENEIYHLALSPDTLKFSAARKIFNSGINLSDQQSPFDEKYAMDEQEKKVFQKIYDSPEFKERQIENELYGSGLTLTGLVSRLVNNTSLAMAIEIESSGHVLLLPADAQSGNWLSWHEEKTAGKLKAGGGKNAKQLLEKTVFYKVGHHGSENGTASKHGLDLMKSQELVAFMPLVQESIPLQWGGAENFPAKELYETLIEKTKGRLVRTDEGLATAAQAVKLRKSLPASTIKALSKTKKGALYQEYTVR